MKFITPEKSTPSRTFVKLSDGKSVVGVFRGDPEIFYQVYEEGKYKVVSQAHPQAQFRFSINFITKENGALVAKVFQGNWHDHESLRALHEEFDLENTFVKVTQSGERQTKRLNFMPMPKHKPDAKQLDEVQLQDLKPRKPSNMAYQGPIVDQTESPPESFDDINF